MGLGHGQTPPTTVLVVDDDDTFRRSMARVLAGQGYAVREAGTAAEARERLESDPDVAAVLCDIQMPGESGLDLLAQLTADLPDLAVVMTTGVDDPRTAAVAFDVGADAYLIKPVTTNEILIALTNALARRRTESARRSHLRELESTVTRLQTLTALLQGIGSPDADAADADDDDTIDRLSRALSLRDEETGGHIERMSRYAALLAEAVDYRERSVDRIRRACVLHDVGKIGVPDTVLLKPGPLSPDEYTAMQRHAQIGYQLLAGSDSALLRTAADVALSHHEWWDGGGYPRGLREDEIPEVARIAAVADVFDALVSNRVYRPGLPVDEAVAIMGEGRGRHFEPRLLDAFLDRLADTDTIRQAYPDREDDERRVRVLVVDDHDIFVQSLVRLLGAQPTIKIVGRAGTVAATYDAVTRYQPDVILMDFELPDGDGVTATDRLRRLLPTVKVVMLTGRTEQAAFVRAIGAGCAGFVTKTEGPDTLVRAIHAAYQGESLTDVPDLPRLLARLGSTHRGLGSDLSPRELEVLQLVTAGLPNKTIARRLDISLHTVRNHVQNILFKLDAHSRLEAVATAVREGVIDRGPEVASG